MNCLEQVCNAGKEKKVKKEKENTCLTSVADLFLAKT